MQLETYLRQKTNLISQGLKDFVYKQDQETLAFDFPVINFLQNFVILGKLYRGGLVFLGYDLFAEEKSSDLNPDELEDLVKTAMAVELTHSAFLLHDDVMDKDRQRRGQPSFHAAVQSFAKDSEVKDDLHLGYSQAICVGDILIFWAGRLLQNAASHAGKPDVFQTYTQEMVKTCWGQMDDVYLAHLNFSPKLEEIVNVLSLKSGHYSIVNPLLLGAKLAGASGKQLQLVKQFGIHMGIVFQVKDDELGLLGDESSLGKKVGSDVKENKKTLYRLFLFDKASTQEKKKLREIFGNLSLKPEQLHYVQKLINKYQIQEAIEQYLNQNYQEAEQAVGELRLEDDSQLLLEQLMQLLKTRKK